jgi:hypothetical protein
MALKAITNFWSPRLQKIQPLPRRADYGADDLLEQVGMDFLALSARLVS